VRCQPRQGTAFCLKRPSDSLNLEDDIVASHDVAAEQHLMPRALRRAPGHSTCVSPSNSTTEPGPHTSREP
jgi:hypothetical protein